MLRHTWAWMCLVAAHAATAVDYSTYPEVVRFQEYIQIDTTTGNDLDSAVTFWKKLAALQNVTVTELELVEGCPILILKWPGSDSTLQPIMLNSHMDVMPANADGWTYPPFGGDITSDGNIWGRGTREMKSVSLQYYEALSRILASGETFERTVYMTLMPDGEAGGICGMLPFVQSTEFAAFNFCFGFDKGWPNPDPFIPLCYHDKAVWQIQVDCHGVAAHGSTMPAINSTAVGQCYNVINTLLDFREEQYEIYETYYYDVGAYTSVNLDIVTAGTATNVIPSHVTLVFDMRLAYDVDEDTFATQLSEWIAAAGSNVTLTYLVKDDQWPSTIINDTCPFFVAINDVASDLSLTVNTLKTGFATDSRYVRGSGIPAYGFTPIFNAAKLVNGIDEHLSLEMYLDGISIYESLIKSIANLSKSVVGTDPSMYLE